ncbi:hypothetical protein PBY51_024307 [Eleginops maclovinus]|uniref:Protein kinase domain-containing protein n=1 Tax=Eleginops maclovinus TaxID=56733 RepID=A0AAN8AVZ3_ELEMC|nr:hypothetical protein PBY51_024307 [Eleginops maclovinus]
MNDNFQVEERAMLYSKSSAYEVQYLLGRGSFGEVAQCRKYAINENVALKVIRRWHSIEDAKNEEEILKQLKFLNSHLFIIVVWNDSFRYKERYCMEFEKLDISLHEFLQKRNSSSLKLKEIRPIVQQLAIALEFLDDTGIVRGDLKPENIMMVDHVRQPLKIKVINFGLAVNNSAQHTGAFLQTQYYRSPEILLGNDFNGAIDVWSLGCTAAEMLTGNILFPGSDEYDMLRHIILGIGWPPSHLLNAVMFTNEFLYATSREEEPPVWRFKSSNDEEDDAPDEASSSTSVPACQTENGRLSSNEHTPFAGHTAEKKRKRDGKKKHQEDSASQKEEGSSKAVLFLGSSSAKKTGNLNENLKDSINSKHSYGSMHTLWIL